MTFIIPVLVKAPGINIYSICPPKVNSTGSDQCLLLAGYLIRNYGVFEFSADRSFIVGMWCLVGRRHNI